MNNLTPYCSYCAVELDFSIHIDEYYDDEDTIICLARGVCPCCKKDYRWEDVYKLHSYRNVEEK